MNMWFYCQELQNIYMSNSCYICYREAKLWLNEFWWDFEWWHRRVWFLMVFLLLFWYSSILLNQVFLSILFFAAFCSHNPLFCGLCMFCRAHWVRGFITSCYHISHRQPTVTWCFLLLVADFRPFQCGFLSSLNWIKGKHLILYSKGNFLKNYFFVYFGNFRDWVLEGFKMLSE